MEKIWLVRGDNAITIDTKIHTSCVISKDWYRKVGFIVVKGDIYFLPNVTT